MSQRAGATVAAALLVVAIAIALLAPDRRPDALHAAPESQAIGAPTSRSTATASPPTALATPRAEAHEPDHGREHEHEHAPELPRGAHRITGVLRLARGGPVGPGAEVEARADGRARRADVDRDGRYALDELPAGEVELVARAPGTREAVVERRALPADGAVALVVDFTLREGTACRGRVLDERGDPVPGAAVEARIRERFEPLAATADAAGAFVFDALPGDAATLVASSPAHAPGAPVEVAYADGREPSVELRVLTAGAVVGRVLDPWSQGVVFARVEALLDGGEAVLVAVTRTDREGRFRFDALAPARLTVRAVCAGFLDARSAPVTVIAGAEASAGDLRLREGAAASGRVVDAQGRGVEGARIDMRRPDEAAPSRHAVSEVDGAWTLEGLEGAIVLRARAQGHLPSAEVQVDVGAGASGVVLALRAMARVGGVVRDAAGRPLRGASVGPLARPDDAARTDADGRFELALEPGEALLVHARGHAAARVEARADLEVRLSPLPVASGGPARLALRRGGAPAAGLVVLWAPAGSDDPARLEVATSDDAGAVRLPAGDLELLVLDPAAARPRTWTRRLASGEAAVAWDLP